MKPRNKPVSKEEHELLTRIEKSGIDPEAEYTRRWEQGMPHDQRSLEVAHAVSGLDWMFFGDAFHFKFGGDGDNGEHLLYMIDVYCALKDKELDAEITQVIKDIHDEIRKDGEDGEANA